MKGRCAMKKMVVLVIGLMLLGSIASASPLTDFSAGKGSIDLTYRDTSIDSTQPFAISTFEGTSGWNKKYDLDAAVTVGVGNNFALQYRTFSPTSGTTKNINNWFVLGSPGTIKFKTDEINLLYKLDKNFNVFVGRVGASGNMNDFTIPSYSGSFPSKNYLQVGLTAHTIIADKTTLWGSVAFAKDLTNAEVGVGYEFSPGWEFNVNYRVLDAKHFDFIWGSGTTDSKYFGLKAEGLGFGITYKF